MRIAVPSGGGRARRIQAGYNLEAWNLVLGLEADFNVASASSDACILGTCGLMYETKLSEFATVRGRLGYALGRALIYVTGGLATGHISHRVTDSVYPASWSSRAWRTGWTAATGVEFMLSPQLSVKGEALYFDLGETRTTYSVDGYDYPAQFRTDDVLARVGLNYRFGIAAPLVPQRYWRWSTTSASQT